MFAGVAADAWSQGDEKLAEAAYELAWEELHTGPWQNVPLVWRDAFALVCLLLASCHERAHRSDEALRFLDLGVIMGGPRFRVDIDALLHRIQSATTVQECKVSEDVEEGGLLKAVGQVVKASDAKKELAWKKEVWCYTQGQ